MITKVVVSKGVYDDVRHIEACTGNKIADKSNAIYHAGLLNNTWGVYQITHCYKSFSKHYAKMKLIEATGGEAEADKRLEFYENLNY